MSIGVKVSSAWKTVAGVSVRVSGAWKTVAQAYIKVAGTWEELLAAAVALDVAATNTYSDNTGLLLIHPINLPASITAGDLLLLFCTFNGSPTVTDPSGWTLIGQGTTPGTYDTLRIYARIADGLEGATVSITINAAQRAQAIAYRIVGNRNGVTSSEIAVSAVNEQAATTNPDPPNLTPSWGSAANLWIAVMFAHDGNLTISAYPSGYTDDQLQVKVSGGSGGAVAAATKIATGTSDDPGVFTTVTSRNLSSFTLAVRPL